MTEPIERFRMVFDIEVESSIEASARLESITDRLSSIVDNQYPSEGLWKKDD